MQYPERSVHTLGEPDALQRNLEENLPIPIERRRFHDPNFEILLHPDHSAAIKDILQLVGTGRLDIDIAHSMILQMLTETAARDQLTGLYEKKAVVIKLGVLMDYCRETGAPISLILIDGYRFKEINDQLGYDIGDETIRIMAQALQETARNDDLSVRLLEETKQDKGNNGGNHNARMGGDEFLIVLPDTDAKQASSVLDRFLKNLSSLSEKHIPEHQSKFGFPITASAGIVQYDPAIDHTPLGFIKRAETVMKQSKEQMRLDRNDLPRI